VFDGPESEPILPIKIGDGGFEISKKKVSVSLAIVTISPQIS